MSIWQNRHFVTLFVGRMLANAGDSLYAIAAMWLVYKLGGSAFYTGLAGFLIMIPNALQLLFGPIAERLPIKKTLVVTQLVQAVVIGLIPIAYWLGWLSVWMILVIMPLLACMNQLVFPIQSALLPILVEKEQLVKANTVFSFAFHGMELVFSVSGGMLLAIIGATSLLWVDAIIFLAAMGCFLSLRLPVERLHEKDESLSVKQYMTNLQEGIALVFRTPLLVAVLGGMIANGAFGMVTGVLPDYANHRGGPEVYGMYLAALSFGMLSGTLIAPLLQRFALGKTTIFVLLISGILWFAAVYVPNVYASIALLALACMPIGAMNVLHSAMIQSVVPRRYFTRVTTVLGSVSVGAMPLGSLLSGFLAVKWGSANMLAVPAFGLLFLSVYWMMLPQFRSLPQVEKITPTVFQLPVDEEKETTVSTSF